MQRGLEVRRGFRGVEDRSSGTLTLDQPPADPLATGPQISDFQPHLFTIPCITLRYLPPSCYSLPSYLDSVTGWQPFLLGTSESAVISALKSTLHLTPLQSALPRPPSRNPFIICTYKKPGGEGISPLYYFALAASAASVLFRAVFYLYRRRALPRTPTGRRCLVHWPGLPPSAAFPSSRP